jgi:pheromone shutdown protein TraB
MTINLINNVRGLSTQLFKNWLLWNGVFAAAAAGD